MKIAIYQTSLTGHHGAYARAIALAAASKGWTTQLLIPQSAKEHPAVPGLQAIVGPSNVLYYPFDVPGFRVGSRFSLARYHYQQHRVAAKAFQLVAENTDLVYIPTLDQMDQAIRVLGPPTTNIPIAGMCLRIKFHLPAKRPSVLRSYFRKRISEASLRVLLSSRNLCCLTTSDPMLAEYCQGRNSILSKISYVPEIGMDEPTIDRQKARDYLGLSGRDRIILVYGALSRRKALPELIAAVGSIESKDSPKILVVGDIADAETKTYLSSPQIQSLVNTGSLMLRAEFADEAVQSAAFAASDAVWVAYTGHQTMSGVFFQAVCSGIPVIAPNYGVMHWLATHHRVGPTVNPTDAVATGAAINRLLKDPETWQAFARNASALAEAHRPLNFGLGVCDAISRSLSQQIAGHQHPVLQVHP